MVLHLEEKGNFPFLFLEILLTVGVRSPPLGRRGEQTQGGFSCGGKHGPSCRLREKKWLKIWTGTTLRSAERGGGKRISKRGG